MFSPVFAETHELALGSGGGDGMWGRKKKKAIFTSDAVISRLNFKHVSRLTAYSFCSSCHRLHVIPTDI